MSNMVNLLQAVEGLGILPVQKRAITNHAVLNEAYAYEKPSSFSRGMRIDLNGLAILLISGTASIDEHGESVHIGDFRAQLRRTFSNITALLEAEGARLRRIQRGTDGVLPGPRPRSAAGVHRHSSHPVPPGAADRDRGHRHVPFERRGALTARRPTQVPIQPMCRTTTCGIRTFGG
jgi:hypothetical protein